MASSKEARAWVEQAQDEGPWYPKPKDVLDFAIAKGGQLVLDVGSGFGDLSSEVVSRGAKVVSLDFSLQYLSKIAALLPESDAVLADATNLPFRNSVFDMTIAKSIWHNIVDGGSRTRFIKELARVTKVGGSVVVSALWNRMYSFVNPKRLLFDRPSDDKFHHYFMPSEVKTTFRLAQLRIVDVQASKMPFRNSLPLLNRFLSPWFHSFYLDVKAVKL